MASSQNEIRNIIPFVKVLPNDYGHHYCGKHIHWSCAAWCCAFSPDESYFAWSSQGILTLLPWKHFQSLQSQPSNSSCKYINMREPKDVELNFGLDVFSIQTGYSVRSIAFGRWKQDCAPVAFWKRRCPSACMLIATGHNNGLINIYDLVTGRLLFPLIDHVDIVTSVSFIPNGTLLLVSASYDGTLKIWDLSRDGNLVQTLKMNGKPIYSCCWAPNSKTMVSVGMSRMAFVWDMSSFSLKMLLKGHEHDIVTCAFSPDGCLIATASWDTHFILWDANSGDKLKKFCHADPSPRGIYASGENGTWVRDISFSQDGAHVVTVADDGLLRLWDIECDDKPEATSFVDCALCCTFSPSGRTIVVGSRDGTLSFLRSETCVKPLQFICRVVIRTCIDVTDIEKLPLPHQVIKYLKCN